MTRPNRSAWRALLSPIVAVLALLAAPLQTRAAEVSCRAFIADYVVWAKADFRRHRVGAKKAAVKIRERAPTTYPWGHGSYAEGGFGLHGDDLEGRFITVFSDRRPAGGKYRFDPAQTDIQDVALYANGTGRILLRSWSNSSIPMSEMKCYSDGVITAIAREVNGVSLVSFVLRKEVIPEGKDPFRDWP